MKTLKYSLPEGAEAARFDTALYGFLEGRAPSVQDEDQMCVAQTIPLRDRVYKSVTFGSEAQASDFRRFWACFPYMT